MLSVLLALRGLAILVVVAAALLLVVAVVIRGTFLVRWGWETNKKEIGLFAVSP